MTGQDPLLPVDLLVQPDPEMENADSQALREHFEKMNQITKQVYEEMKEASRQMKRGYDRDAFDDPQDIQPGDLVRLIRAKKGKKKDLKYLSSGPYRVVACDPNRPNTLYVRMVQVDRTINVNRLRRWNAAVPAYVQA